MGLSVGAGRRATFIGWVVVAVACAACVAPAEAKSTRKGAWLSTDRLAPIEFSRDLPPSPAPARPAISGPVRFFTINQVLAKYAKRSPKGTDVAALEPDNRASDTAAPLSAEPPRGPEPFGMYAFRAPEGALWRKWRKLSEEMRAEADALAQCRRDPQACSREALAFDALLAQARSLDGEPRLRAVSEIVNAAIRYTTDYAQHGVADLWSAPLATLASRRGDCEDYAILKYALLREVGVAQADLRIVLLRDTMTREDHAVLGVRQADHWYILDNRRAGFYRDDELPHYMPLFALNDSGVSLFAAPYVQRALDAAESTLAPAAAEWGTEPAPGLGLGIGTLPPVM